MLSPLQQQKIVQFCHALIDQERARILIEPMQRRDGFWFGGGNLSVGPDGAFYLVGRYRNFGDSRTGLGAGERGLELALFRSVDRLHSFEKLVSLPKSALSVGGKTVLSIEGSALRFGKDGSGQDFVELYVSSEKDVSYPAHLQAHQKPNTGVWSIDRISAPIVDGLADAPVEPLVACEDARYLHVKDPFLLERADGSTVLGFVTHPYSWASSNTGYCVRGAGALRFDPPVYDFFPRGNCWDVAICRGTGWLTVPRMGVFGTGPPCTLLFYDGGESMRNLDEHTQAVRRPRGYSCEELGGVALADASGVAQLQRLSVEQPLFVSPHGAGTSRYVEVLETSDGFYAIWQQSQPDLSQPLVGHFLSRSEADSVLS